MLFRRDQDDIIAIPQPSHAWLSGQLARAWGNEAFSAPAPHEEVCLGAEQHDIAWLPWEAAPTFNPATGLPHDFREIDAKTRVDLWTEGIFRALSFGLYPTLLISLHAHTIHSRSARPNNAPPADEGHRRMQAFLQEQQAFRQSLLKTLAAQPRYREFATAEIAERNRLFVFAVDRMSLEICWGVRGEVVIPGVPKDDRTRIDLRLRSRTGAPDDLILDPWPFSTGQCKLICEGRRLEKRFDDEAAMRKAVADPAKAVLLEMTLRPC
jgi:hypothetical protein